uniref:Chromosome 9 open reading frame 85 n=1 Tax=Bos mutus grunniens TaxID=30521 RepID=A0A8B9YKJ1_BOSMU
MSSQKGNVTRSRPQRHQNTFSFKNDKFDKSVQTKKINAKLHDGVCQRCKEVLEWRVKYSKYKPLSKPKKCYSVLTSSLNVFPFPFWEEMLKFGSVKCLQKTVKDSYHIMCRPCACELEVCAKCGKKEDVVIPFNKEPEKTENVENNLRSSHRRSCRRNEVNDDDLDFDIDLDDTEEEDN